MKLTYFVNAMFMLEGANSRVLCDPWITFDRQSQSGLYNFPECSLSRQDVAALKPDFIYLTHTHADHFDAPTLDLFDPATPILIAPYADNFTERAVRLQGFTDVRVVDAENGAPLNGDDRCWIEPSFVYPEVDSIGTFKIDGTTVINANDVPYSQEQCDALYRRFSPIDLAMVPFSFQGPYPAFYENLSDDERREEADAKKMRSYEQLCSYVTTLQPKHVFPFAGGAVYGGRKALLADCYGVGSAEEAVSILAESSPAAPILLSDGVSFDFETGTRTGTYVVQDYQTERSYLQAVAEQSGPFDEGGLFYVHPSQRIDLTRILTRARLRQKARQDKRGTVSDAVFFLDVGEPLLYRFALADESVTRIREDEIADDRYEIFRLPYSLLIGLLTGHYNWSNVKTQHMWFYRQPNEFDAELHVLMSYLQA